MYCLGSCSADIQENIGWPVCFFEFQDRYLTTREWGRHRALYRVLMKQKHSTLGHRPPNS